VSRALTSYTVLVVTLVSMLAITYLSLLTIQNFSRESENNTMPTISDDYNIQYIIRSSGVYVRIDHGIDRLIEEVVFTNNTVEEIVIGCTDVGLYGPLHIPENASKIILIGYDEKPILLDILDLYPISKRQAYELEGPLPPSLQIGIGDGGLGLLDMYNGSNKYYVLKPVIYTRSLDIREGYEYVITSSTIYSNRIGDYRYVVVENASIEPGIVDERFRELVYRYGWIRENRSYTLNIYPYKEFKLNPFLFSIMRPVSSSEFTIVYTVPLNDIVLDKNLLIRISIVNNIVQFTITDNYGRTYKAVADIKVSLQISNNTFTKEVLLNETSIRLDGGSVVLDGYNHTFLSNGTYSLTLKYKYKVKILEPISSTALLIISQYVYGGYENYYYIKTYQYDKLVITAGDQYIVYRPLENNTIVQVGVSGRVYSDTILYNMMGYTIDRLVINYTGISPVIVSDEAVPVSIIEAPLYVRIGNGTGIIVYVINESSNDIIYGLYYQYGNATVELSYLPIYYCGGCKPVIVEDTSLKLYLLDTVNNTYIVLGDNITICNTSIEIHGFAILEESRYDYPVLVVRDSIGLNATITVSYPDGESISYMINSGENYYGLYNEIINSIELVVDNPLTGRIVYSQVLGKPFSIITDRGVYQITGIHEITIMDHKALLITTSTGESIIY
jgi:hypothetical protein